MLKNLFVFVFISATLLAQTGSIKGRITDGASPIPSVNILVMNTGIGAVSDINGRYELRNVPIGEQEIRFSSVGFETQFFELNIQSNKTIELDVVMPVKVIEVGTVEVTGIQGQDQRDTRTSLIDVNPQSAKIMPGAVEDVFRTLQSLPGVLAPNDFSSQLVVRGSGPDQNLIVMDDVEVFNPYRLYGLISMFNPQAVSDISLITGGFPAKYGDRLSAVLDVTNKEGTTSEYLRGNVNASIVDANVVIEGKNPFNLRGSWLLNSRRTYYDLIIEPFVKNAGLVDDNTTFPNFYDLQTKIVLGPFNGHKFFFNGIYSRDGVNVVSGKERNTPDSLDVYNSTRNDVVSFAWHYTPLPKLFNKLIVSWYRTSGETEFESQILDPSINRKGITDFVPDTLAPYLLNLNFRADFAFRKYSIDDKFTYLWGDHIFEAGAGVDFMTTIMDFRFDIDPELVSFFASNPQFRAALSDVRDVKHYNRYRAYVQNNFKLTDRMFIQPGLRFDHYKLLEKSYLAPRLGVSYALSNVTTLRAVWGMYFQSPGYEKMRDGGALLNLDREYTTQLNAERSIHYVLGVDHWLSSEWNLKLEGYYKDFNDLIEQKIVTGSRYFTEPVPGKDLRYSSGWTRPITVQGDSITQIPVNSATGESFGIEVLLAKKNLLSNSKLSGWVSYSLAYANTFQNGNKYPFRFDQRHTLNVVLNYQFNTWFDVGVRWQFGSGFPYTRAEGIRPRIIMKDLDLDGTPETPVIATRKSISNPDSPEEVIYDIYFGENRFNDRKPDYHRLDIRFTFLANFWNLDWAFYLDVINVYNRKNVIAYDYFVTEDLKLDREQNNMFPIIPTLGFNVRF